MRSNVLLLLRTLLLSTSPWNVYRHTSDSKKRRQVVGGAIGFALLYALVMAYCILMCVGYGMMGLVGAVPVLCALTVSALAFVFTLFKTNGYLFNFKEYDMLLSLPFEARTVVASKFLYMYIDSLPWYASISVAMMVGYGCFAHPAVVVYPVWLVLCLTLPIAPMLVAAFLGFVIAKISTGFKRTNIVQTVLVFAFVVVCFASRFFVEDLFRNNKVQQTLETVSQATNDAANVYLPARWFANAVAGPSVLDALLLVGASALLFAVVFAIVGRSYKSINSALRSHAATKSYKMGAQRQRSVVGTIAFKELKRLTGSTTYMTNGAIGLGLSALFGIVTLVFGFDNIVAMVTHDAPFDHAILQPAIPFIVYFFVGMFSTTACSPSLEGKNYWIVASLPLEKKTLYQGKMLFNLCLTLPFMAFCTLCLCISAGVPALNTALYLVLGIALCAFSTAWGCVCGVKHMRLDWENEVEVIKQGAAVALYMLPNMFVVMGLTVLVVFLGLGIDHRLLTLAFCALVSVLAGLSYWRVMTLCELKRSRSIA